MDETQFKLNYEYFQKILPDLLNDPEYKDTEVVIYNQELKMKFNDFHTAYAWALENCGYDSGFIIQSVPERHVSIPRLGIW